MEDLLLTILGSIGGTTVILGGLFGWLGKRYLDKTLEAERSSNKEKLTLLQSDISKDIEQHKSKLKFNEKFLDNQLEASFKLYKIMKKMLPEKTHSEMDWYDACNDIAYNFNQTKKEIASFLEDHYTTLPPEIYETLQETEYMCADGHLEIDGPEVPDFLNAEADKVFQNIKDSCIKLKSYIDGERETKEAFTFLKKTSNK